MRGLFVRFVTFRFVSMLRSISSTTTMRLDNDNKTTTNTNSVHTARAARTRRLNVSNCLQYFGEAETLSKEDAWCVCSDSFVRFSFRRESFERGRLLFRYCRHCQQHVCATKRMGLWRLPVYVYCAVIRFHSFTLVRLLFLSMAVSERSAHNCKPLLIIHLKRFRFTGGGYARGGSLGAIGAVCSTNISST
jgi:ubiquitin C-terminal hydrolase